MLIISHQNAASHKESSPDCSQVELASVGQRETKTTVFGTETPKTNLPGNVNRVNSKLELSKSLTAFQLVCLGVGATIGAGIFVVTGEVARRRTGPALFLSYLIASFVCTFSALCYTEFAAMVPNAGSAYAYAMKTLGPFMGWIVGWNLLLEYLVSASAVAQGWSKHLNELLHIMGTQLPLSIASPAWDQDMHTGIHGTGAIFDLPAILIVVLITLILTRGVQESARMNDIMVFIKVGVVLLVIFLGATYINVPNFHPFFPYGFFSFSIFGYTVAGLAAPDETPVGVLAGASIVFFAFIGFDAVCCQAEECKNPQRDLPIGILGSLFISALLYAAVSVVLVGMVPYNEINEDAPFPVAFSHFGATWARVIITIGALFGMTSVLLVSLLGQSRILMAMSRDLLIPKYFSVLHPKYKTPYISSLIVGVLVSIIGTTIPLTILVELVSMGTLFAFTVVCISIPVLRKTSPDLPRPFKCPWVPFVPITGAILCIILMFSLSAMNWLRFAVWLLVGTALYFLYAHPRIRAKSKKEDQQESAIELDPNQVPQITVVSEKIHTPA